MRWSTALGKKRQTTYKMIVFIQIEIKHNPGKREKSLLPNESRSAHYCEPDQKMMNIKKYHSKAKPSEILVQTNHVLDRKIGKLKFD